MRPNIVASELANAESWHFGPSPSFAKSRSPREVVYPGSSSCVATPDPTMHWLIPRIHIYKLSGFLHSTDNCRLWRKIAVIGGLTLWWLMHSGTHGFARMTVADEAVSAGQEKPAPVPVPTPDLSRLDRIVQEQFHDAQSKLTAMVQGSDAKTSDIAQAYGDLGKLYQAYDLKDAALACYLNAQSLDVKNFQWRYYDLDPSVTCLYQSESDGIGKTSL